MKNKILSNIIDQSDKSITDLIPCQKEIEQLSFIERSILLKFVTDLKSIVYTFESTCKKLE